MRRFLFPSIVLCLLGLGIAGCGGRQQKAVEEETAVRDTIPPLGFFTEDYFEKRGEVRSGETFSGLLGRLGLSTKTAYDVAQMCSDSVFSVRKMRAGNTYRAYYADSLAAEPSYLVYENNLVDRTVFQFGDSLDIRKVSRPVSTVRKYADVVISSSLWNDMTSAGSSPLLILKLSDIYAWTVDFFGLQKDDRFRVIYGQKEVEGQFMAIDTIYFACFTRDSTNLYAVMFDQGDGGNIYWNEKGESMRKAFLKAPLEFKRVSSKFSYARKHPVTGKVRPHTGVDYAAPMGTPVVALGDGTVLSAGWGGGGGNTIKIRHNSVYTTGYLHLSRFAKGIKAGVRVQQGQVIGYVGSTGTSTGPHLDFRVWQNGQPINPLKMESPSAEPISAEFKPALDSVFRVRLAELESE
jgi:murein DD-endopeptidase MepM/ murein hydrolase activator NlpD